MADIYKAVKLTDKVYWVGAIDWTIRDFHGYTTHRGSTYNAYLILADKITLVDTVKAPFREELISRIASVVDPRDIKIIVSNHSEMDHTGCLYDLIDLVRPDQVVASTMGTKTLGDIYHRDRIITPIKDGGELSLGNMSLRFMETRMLHWPDSMFSSPRMPSEHSGPWTEAFLTTKLIRSIIKMKCSDIIPTSSGVFLPR